MITTNRNDIKITYLKQNISRWTFSSPKVGEWVKNVTLSGEVLNLFAGKTHLFENDDNHIETRVDISDEFDPPFLSDAALFLQSIHGSWETIILDPPYSYRKSMEKYKGKTVSNFRKVKDLIIELPVKPKRVITFGYQSVSMGESRGYKVSELLIVSHGGAYHDTIATVEDLMENCK